MSIEVIVPTREMPVPQCITGINLNTPPITNYHIIGDTGEGQTLIRYRAAKESKSDYILILDDDVFMREGVVQLYLNKIQEGYDGVCGSTNPAPTGSFGKYVKQYMTNPETPFYPVGCTLWKRERFVQLMEEIGVETSNHIADNILGNHIRRGGYRVCRVEEAISDHITHVTLTNFFRKRVVYGAAIAELTLIQKEFIKVYLKMLFGIPLAIFSPGTFVYRFATFLGMTKYLVRGKN